MKKNLQVKSVLLITVFNVLFLSGFAQNMTSEQAKDLKNRTLLVSLTEESESEIKELQKEKKSIDEYKQIVKNDNAALKNAVEKYWKLSSYKFMPDQEARDLMKKEPEKYAMLAMVRYIDYEHWGGWTMTGHGNPGEAPSMANFNNTLPHYDFTPSQYTAENEIMEFRLFMPKRIFSVGLPRMILTEADAIYGVKQLLFYCNRLAAEDKSTAWKIIKSLNGQPMKNKTLLLNKQDVDDKLTDADIKKEYTSGYKLVSQDEIDKAVTEEKDFAIVQIISAEGGKGNVSMQYIVNAGTGEIYGIVYPKVAFGIKGTNWIKWNQRIKKKQMGEFEDVSNGKN